MKIGDIITIEGEQYKVIEGKHEDGCDTCDLTEGCLINDHIPTCITDNYISIIYKKLKSDATNK